MANAVHSVSSENYRKYLVEAVKAAGHMLLDSAEDVVGNTDNICDFQITFDFNQELCDSIPKMTVMRSHMPSCEVMEDLIAKRFDDNN